MDVRYAAKIIGVSEPRVYQLIREGRLEATNVSTTPKNARWDIDEDSMRKLIANRDIAKAARESSQQAREN